MTDPQPPADEQAAATVTPPPKKGGKLKWILGAIAVLIIIVAIASSGDDDKTSDDKSSPGATTTAAATATTATTSEPEPEPEPADTGRMSTGEFDDYTTWWIEFNHEREQFFEALPKCAAIVGAGQFAEASECIGDAYSGFETNSRLLISELDDVELDVAGACRAAVRNMRTSVQGFSDAMATSAKAGENLQFDELEDSTPTLVNEAKRLAVRQGQLVVQCSPE